MSKVDTVNRYMPADSGPGPGLDASPQIAPAQFFLFSIPLAICFGLALLAQILATVLRNPFTLG